MRDVALTVARAHLAELVERASGGETVRITLCGRPVAQITGLERPRKPIALADLRALTDSMPMQPESAATWMRKVRDGERY